MVGHLHLQGMEDSPKEQSREGLLDSPDSGLPPSPGPSPPFYSLAPGILDARAGGGAPEPPGPGEARAHFRDKVFYVPVPTVTAYSETIVAAPNCTWRSYRSQLTLEPRLPALHFRSTTVIFPKRARTSFRTTLHCSLGRPSRWFSSRVELQLCQAPGPHLLGPAATP
ncbi:Protein FAM101A [Tupaia chinensis]|uniref:Protein FAM101A n=1 Tax=Tupaia chinensis TaxID=246437 RepID=L9KWC2_TUPCH|nr:Protein FAM101A [Tupaia chinensis]